MLIQCLTHLPLLKQGCLHVGDKAALEKTVKIGSELFAYSCYHRSYYIVRSLLPLDLSLTWKCGCRRTRSWCPLVPSAGSWSWSLRTSLWCAAYKAEMVLEHQCLEKTSLGAWKRKTIDQGEILDKQGLEQVCGREEGGSQAGEG